MKEVALKMALGKRFKIFSSKNEDKVENSS